MDTDVPHVQLFSRRLNQDQHISALVSGGAGVLVAVPAVITEVLMRDQPMQWTYVVLGYVLAAVPGTYIVALLMGANGGKVRVSANVVFVAIGSSSLALLCGQLGTRVWSGNAYMAALVLPCIFWAVVGDTRMIVIGASQSVAMVDLDHFKQFNDRLGHLAGDALLRNLSVAMSNRLCTADLLTRYGGEEFCLVLPETDLERAIVVIDDLRTITREVSVEGSSPTISIGVVEWDRVESLHDLIQRADEVLYQAKKQGRDRGVHAVPKPRG